jgi:carbon monoxide dehydrogenase subunit G
MAKFPTEVERSVEVHVPLEQVYAFFWDVVGSARCIPGLEKCRSVRKNTYEFLYEPRSTGPVSMVVRYTTAYTGNGTDEITFRSVGGSADNTDAEGRIQLKPTAKGTRITLRQRVAPDTPVPRLVQGVIRSFVEREAATAVESYLSSVKRELERGV